MRALILLLALAAPAWWRATNSHAAAARGARSYEGKQYAQAAEAFAEARQLASSPRAAFNLATAEIAAGQREQGSARMAEALRDPALRADALFNRGNSALAAKAVDHAVRDYVEALKANPNHAAAKRNLEIALRRRDEQQRQQAAAGGQQDQKGQSQKQPQQPAPSPQGQQKPQAGQVDLETLLRSVQQQEEEELRRMRGRAAAGRVGW